MSFIVRNPRSQLSPFEMQRNRWINSRVSQLNRLAGEIAIKHKTTKMNVLRHAGLTGRSFNNAKHKLMRPDIAELNRVLQQNKVKFHRNFGELLLARVIENKRRRQIGGVRFTMPR